MKEGRKRGRNLLLFEGAESKQTAKNEGNLSIQAKEKRGNNKEENLNIFRWKVASGISKENGGKWSMDGMGIMA